MPDVSKLKSPGFDTAAGGAAAGLRLEALEPRQMFSAGFAGAYDPGLWADAAGTPAIRAQEVHGVAPSAAQATGPAPALPAVEILYPERTATEKGARAAHVTVTRAAALGAAGAASLANPLTVHYSIGGTAANGKDFQKLSGVVTIPARQASAPITIVPLRDRLAEAAETVVLRLRPEPNYLVGLHRRTSMVQIADDPVFPTWPAAPFPRAERPLTVYANQNGTAILQDQSLTSANSFNGYNLFYDDGGPVAISASGQIAADVAFYDQAGQPLAVDPSAATPLRGSVSPDKDMQFVGVKPHAAGTSGRYDLRIDGPAEGVVYPLDISSKDNSGSSGSDISGTYDIDFYEFTLPRAGNWVVQAIPDQSKDYPQRRLDLQMNVFDAHGNPVGGTFTQAIDKGGVGATETWTGIGLKAGAVYYARVNASNNHVGGYGISVAIADRPDVGIKPAAPATPANAGRFVVTRSDTTGGALTVKYTVSGTARAGKDFQPLSGSLTIPAGQLSASLTLKTLRGAAADGDKTVVLTLAPDADYNLTSFGGAVFKILRPKVGKKV